MTDEQSSVLQRIARGDREAASECISTYSGLVWSLARRRFANEADAEEAVQDIFMQLWRQAGRFDPTRGEEVTFVSLLARRRLVDRLRKQGRAPVTTPLDEATPQLSEDGRELLERSADVRRVRAVLRTLEPKQREIIHLSSWLGMSHGAIAERTGIPLGTVKSHLRRGLMKVREQLGEAKAVADGATS